MHDFQTVKANTPRMTDGEFMRFLEDNPDLRIERDANKVIYIMASNFTRSSIINGIIIAQLSKWNSKNKSGFITDAMGSYLLPDNSLRMPDVAWIAKSSWKKLSQEERKKFVKLVPGFVVEVKSSSDSLAELQQKMNIGNGVKLGWLIDPAREKVWIYRDNGETDTAIGFDRSLSGENVLKGFTLKLRELHID
ncbi:MAG: Uma2 family endonuclease [Cyclobacteriaceae bacterium]|nr:Uma2 family endonuclease [Cyclobacteriaceae bacterium]